MKLILYGDKISHNVNQTAACFERMQSVVVCNCPIEQNSEDVEIQWPVLGEKIIVTTAMLKTVAFPYDQLLH